MILYYELDLGDDISRAFCATILINFLPTNPHKIINIEMKKYSKSTQGGGWLYIISSFRNIFKPWKFHIAMPSLISHLSNDWLSCSYRAFQCWIRDWALHVASSSLAHPGSCIPLFCPLIFFNDFILILLPLVLKKKLILSAYPEKLDLLICYILYGEKGNLTIECN